MGIRERHDAHVVLGITPRISHANVGLTASLLAKKLRIGVATTPKFLRTRGRGNPFVTVGLNDFNGLIYWPARLRA